MYTYYSYVHVHSQGIRASPFCTDGELQNSYEHCGGHAEKVVNMNYTDSKQFCVFLLHWLSSVEHIYSRFHQAQYLVNTYSLERTHLSEGRKGLDYYMLDDILVEIRIL